MDIRRKQLLKRWKSLQEGTGLVRSVKFARLLSAAGLLLVLLVTCAVAYRLSPIFVAALSAVTGWVIAERNALNCASHSGRSSANTLTGIACGGIAATAHSLPSPKKGH